VAALLELSRLSLAAGRGDKAASYAQQALTADPQNSAAQGLLARAQVIQHRVGEAQALVAAIQRKYPDAAETYNLLGTVQLGANQQAAARASYVKALALDPKNVEALSGLTALDLSAGHRAEAVARITGVIDAGSPSADLLMFAAKTYAAAGELPLAEKTLEKAIQSDPARVQGYTMLGELYARQNRLDEARARFEAVLQRDPNSVPVATMLGMVLETQGKIAEAEKQYQHVLSLDPRAAVASNNLAWIYAAANRNLDEALQMAQNAHQILPESPQVNDTLGWVYVRKNLGQLALPYLESSVKARPADPSALYHLGVAYIQTDDRDKARAALNKALSLKPDFDGAADARKALANIGA